MLPTDPQGMANPMPPQMGVQQASPPGMMPPMMPMAPPKMYDVKLKRCIKSGQLKIKSLPPEDFLLDPTATTLEDGRFYGDVTRMTRSDAKLKWPKKAALIDDLPAYTVATEEGEEKQARNNRLWSVQEILTDKSTEEIEIFETYIQVDYDGDGVAEWRQVTMGGFPGSRQMLANDEYGEHPYFSVTPDPMPHRYRGRSVYDEVGDIQRVKTVLNRQLLDNLYLVNNPMLGANSQAIENKDALHNPEVGGIVWTNGPPGDSMMPIVVPYIGDKIFTSLEYHDMVMEKRTGVSRSTMAMDMDALQHQTATAVNAQQSSAFGKVEAYARNIAECGGLKELFSKLLKLFVENQKSVKYLKVRGDFVKMDPRGWNADMRVSINVGLGAGSRDRDMAMLAGLAGKQELVVENLKDPFNPFCNIGHLFETYRKMTETGGLKNPEQYFPEITQEQVQQISQQMQQNPPPTPEDKKLQGDMQIAQMQEAGKAQADQRRAQMDQAQFQQKAAIEKEQAQADIATNNQKIQMEDARAERQFQFEMQLKREEHAMKLQQMRETHGLKMAELQAQSAHREREAQIGLVESAAQLNMQRESHEQSMELKPKEKPLGG